MSSLGLILMLGFFLLGCVNPKSEKNITFSMDPLDQSILKVHCEEINSHGDILQLLQEIKRDTKEVLRILEVPGKTARDELSVLAERINEKSQRIGHLSKEEWTTERWHQEVIWRIDAEDFSKSLGTLFENGFSILDTKIEGLYLMGQTRADLSAKFSIEHEGNVILISYKSLGSSLELCQLQKTLIVVLDVYTRSVMAKRHHYFGLHIR